MPVTMFDKKLLKRVIGYAIDDKTLTDQTQKMGFTVEELTDEFVSIEFPANRPELLSAVGFARALRFFMHKSSGYSYALKDKTPALEINVGKAVHTPRPFISGLVVIGAEMDEPFLKDLINFTEKFCYIFGRNRGKIAIGIHNLDAVVPPLTYDAYGDESYVPLNGTKETRFSEVIAKHEKGIEFGGIVKGKHAGRYVALKDKKGTMALIPILNSERTKTTVKTKNLFIDITGTSQYSVEKAADMLAALFIDMKWQVKPVAVNYGKKKRILPGMEATDISLPTALAESEIGVPIGPNNIISLANKMGYDAAILGTKVRFRVPAYRLDIINDQDLVEDLAIAYGYDYIQRIPVSASQRGGVDAHTLSEDRVREVMLGLGYSESMNTYLTNERVNFTDMLLEASTDVIRLKNAQTTYLTMMRTWLLPSLLKNAGQSISERMPQRLFELDMVFAMGGRTPLEGRHMAAVAIDPKVNFNDIVADFNSMSGALKLGCALEPFEHHSFIPGRCAKISIGNVRVGYIGEVHPQVLSNFGIEEPVVALEIDLDAASL